MSGTNLAWLLGSGDCLIDRLESDAHQNHTDGSNQSTSAIQSVAMYPLWQCIQGLCQRRGGFSCALTMARLAEAPHVQGSRTILKAESQVECPQVTILIC